MTDLYLIRHGDYVYTDAKNHLIDRGLSEKGIDQAQRLRDRLAASGEIRAQVLITSTMLRARQTAEIIAPALKQMIIQDADFEEWRNTDGQLTPEQFGERLNATMPDQRVFFRPVRKGETWAEFIFRACTAFNRITQTYRNQTIVIVCHGGIVEASFMFFFKLSMMQPPPVAVDPVHTSITRWYTIPGLNPDKWMLDSFNDTAHLK